MRRAEGKEFGYIILPIAQAPQATAQESVSNSAYKAVWQVINAISAHDDRFEAQINQLALTYDKNKPDYASDTSIGVVAGDGAPQDTSDDVVMQATLPLIIAGSSELRDAILARIVDRYADPGYWEQWARSVRDIAQRHEARIRAMLNRPDSDVRPVFDSFLTGLRHNLNDGISEDDAIGMLSQHPHHQAGVRRPVRGLCPSPRATPSPRRCRRPSKACKSAGWKRKPRAWRTSTEMSASAFRALPTPPASRKSSPNSTSGSSSWPCRIPPRGWAFVYTPVEVVDYIVRSVEDVLDREFGASVSDEGGFTCSTPLLAPAPSSPVSCAAD